MGTPVRILGSKIISHVSPSISSSTLQVPSKSPQCLSRTSANCLKVPRRLEYTANTSAGQSASENRTPDKRKHLLAYALETDGGNGEKNCSLVINTPNKQNLMKNGMYPRTPELKVLGKGTFGTVVRGLYQDRNVAVKIVRHDSHQATEPSPLREQNLIGLAHKNIVSIIDVVYKENCSYGVVLMEYLSPSRELQSLLDDQTAALPMKDAIKFGLDICRGLEYCHKNGVLHMDLKPANILVFNERVCKLCDFGNSVRMGTTENSTRLLLGTVPYTAPEILLGRQPTEKSDLYSLGIVLWQMKQREIPYNSIDCNEVIIYRVVKFHLRPDGGGEGDEDGEFTRLYKECWRALPELRPRICDVIDKLLVLHSGLE